MDGVKLVMGRGGGAGQVVDLVHFHHAGNGDVMADYFKSGIVRQVKEVLLAAREEVVHADDFMAFFQKPFAEVGADEAGSSGDQNPFTHDSMSMRFALRRAGREGGYSCVEREFFVPPCVAVQCHISVT